MPQNMAWEPPQTNQGLAALWFSLLTLWVCAGSSLELIGLILWNNAAFLPPCVTFPYFLCHQTEDFSLHEAYQELKTLKIELEERNVFCGPYKTHVLMEQ